MFKAKYVGHAGWLIENDNFRCLCDPWFGPQGAYFGQWYPFPRNSHLMKPSLYANLDFIYISHVHEDHYDKWFLEKVDKNTPIYTANFSDKTLLNGLQKMGFKVYELSDNEDIKVKNISIKIIKEESHLDADSCILFDDGKNKILNLNDCHIDFSKLKKHASDIDLLLLQATSAIWWPCTYNYDRKLMRKHGRTKRENNLNRALEYSKYLNAKMTIPNAGPPCFHDNNLDKWNYNRRKEWNPFVLADDACAHLKNNNVRAGLVIPGSTINVGKDIQILNNQKEIEKIYNDVDSYMTSYRAYLNIYANKKEIPNHNRIDNALVSFVRHIRQIKKISKFYTKQIDGAILFDFQDWGKWIVDFSKDEPIFKYNKEEYIYSFIVDPSSLAELFEDPVIDFEKYFLGCNFSCTRNPDTYNEPLFALLKHFDLKRFIMSEKLYANRGEVFSHTYKLEHKGCTLNVQKYCPHMMADLEEIGYVDENNNLVCPLHGWKFDLSTGDCLNNKKVKIKIEEIAND